MRLTTTLIFLITLCFYSVHAQTDEQTSEAANAAMMQMMGGSDVQVQEEYQFDHRFVLLMESFNKKGKAQESNEMTFLTKDESSLMGMKINQEGIETEMIYDMESFEIVTLMNVGSQKMGTTMAIDKGMVKDMMADDSSEDAMTAQGSEMPVFKATGNSKSISGYSCDEYLVENLQGAEGAMTYWITEELEVDWIKSMSNMSGMNKQMPDIYAGTGYPENGSVVQMVVNEKNGERFMMTLKEAEPNANITISTKGYTFMNMPGR